MVKRKLKNDSTNVNPDNRPAFFKIMYDGLTNEHLRIPPVFVGKYLSEEASDRGILKGPSSDHWSVEVCKNKDGMFLKDGWLHFVSDHSIRHQEVLLFTYDGNMHFEVQIFEKTGCERVDVSVINSHQESAFSNGKRKPGRPRKNPIGSLQVHQLNTCKSGTGSSLRTTPPTEEDEDKVLEVAESFTSTFPYFEICLNQSSVLKGFMQPIPWSFAKTNLPKVSRAKIILKNPKGEAWEVICVYNGIRYAFSGGWCAFVRANKLKVDDICIFELVDKHKMQVHIFQSSKEA